MPAFQIQVQGTLDGVTPFVIPDPLPAPSDGGVIKIDAGVGISVGIFDLCALIGAVPHAPVWLRAFHVEMAPLTRAMRAQSIIPGNRAPEDIVPVQASIGTPLMRLSTLSTKAIVPAGATQTILTDDTDETFTGAPVAGPHFVYFELDPLPDDEELALVQDLEAFASAKSDAQGQAFNSFQAVAATAIDPLGLVISPVVGPSGAMQVQSVQVKIGDAPAAGESMLIGVQRVINGTGALSTVTSFTIDNTFAANTTVEIPVSQASNLILEGDQIQINRVYTAGGGPTPLTDTLVRFTVVPVAQ